MAQQEPGEEESKPRGWLFRLVGAVIIVVAIIGLPVRLYWEDYFRGIGLVSFLIGMLIGVLVSGRISSSPRLSSKKATILSLMFMPLLFIAAYLLFLESIDHPGPSFLRLAWEFGLYAAISLGWGLLVELAARKTFSLGKPKGR
jgi:hypothetical protein